MTDVAVLVVDDAGDAHGDAVLAALSTLGLRSLRYNLADLHSTPVRWAQGRLDLYRDATWHRLASSTTVWWRRVGMVDVSGLDGEEARLAIDEGPHVLRGALMSAGVRWVDDPFDVERAELKLHQLGIAASLGIPTPASCVTNEPSTASEFERGRPLVAKALSPGQGIAPFVDAVSAADVERVAALPTLLQERVGATADLRLVVVRDEVWAWRRSRSDTTLDWRREDPDGTGFRPVDSDAVAILAHRLNSALRLSMSVQDWLETDDGPVFLEVNPQGAWLFLEGAPQSVTPAVARHLAVSTPAEAQGLWPRAIKRFFWDFLPASKAPENDGVRSPELVRPSWASAAASRPGGLDVARRAHDEAKSGAKAAEDKANRLVQASLALLTITLAVGAFQAQFALDRSPLWLLSLGPAVTALVCLSLAAFEGLEIDRVGVYRHPTAEDISVRVRDDPVAVLIAEEEIGRRLARWTSDKKHSDLMQARAWFSRGLAALIIAALVAAIGRAAANDGTIPSNSTSTTSVSLTTTTRAVATTVAPTSTTTTTGTPSPSSTP